MTRSSPLHDQLEAPPIIPRETVELLRELLLTKPSKILEIETGGDVEDDSPIVIALSWRHLQVRFRQDEQQRIAHASRPLNYTNPGNPLLHKNKLPTFAEQVTGGNVSGVSARKISLQPSARQSVQSREQLPFDSTAEPTSEAREFGESAVLGATAANTATLMGITTQSALHSRNMSSPSQSIPRYRLRSSLAVQARSSCAESVPSRTRSPRNAMMAEGILKRGCKELEQGTKATKKSRAAPLPESAQATTETSDSHSQPSPTSTQTQSNTEYMHSASLISLNSTGETDNNTIMRGQRNLKQKSALHAKQEKAARKTQRAQKIRIRRNRSRAVEEVEELVPDLSQQAKDLLIYIYSSEWSIDSRVLCHVLKQAAAGASLASLPSLCCPDGDSMSTMLTSHANNNAYEVPSLNLQQEERIAAFRNTVHQVWYLDHSLPVVSSYLRRIYLYRLSNDYKLLLKVFSTNDGNSNLQGHKREEKKRNQGSRASTRACAFIDEIWRTQAESTADSSGNRLTETQLKNRRQNYLRSGQNWANLIDKLSLGVVFAIPPSRQGDGPAVSFLDQMKDKDMQSLTEAINTLCPNFIKISQELQSALYLKQIFTEGRAVSGLGALISYNSENATQRHPQVQSHNIADFGNCIWDDSTMISQAKECALYEPRHPADTVANETCHQAADHGPREVDSGLTYVPTNIPRTPQHLQEIAVSSSWSAYNYELTKCYRAVPICWNAIGPRQEANIGDSSTDGQITSHSNVRQEQQQEQEPQSTSLATLDFSASIAEFDTSPISEWLPRHLQDSQPLAQGQDVSRPEAPLDTPLLPEMDIVSDTSASPKSLSISSFDVGCTELVDIP